MNSGYYAACTALMARTQSVETIANNLANTSTTGFRASHNVFRSMLVTAGTAPLSMLNQDANDYSILSGSRIDTTQGALVPTNNDLDIAIEGPGYFAVQTASGNAYTRSGSFHLSPKGQLITGAGDPVLGDTGKPITIVGQPVAIAQDGTISVDGAVTGRLRLVEFPATVQMESTGAGYYAAPNGATPGAAANSKVRQGMLESSNVNPVTSVVDLINTQREVEAMRHALSLLNNDIDKTAVQDLPHVS